MLCSILQRYNSKAIHNVSEITFTIRDAVFNTSKIQFKSNSQHLSTLHQVLHRCVQYFKDTIQKQFTTTSSFCFKNFRLCSILQRYNSKAIHNHINTWEQQLRAVFNTSKIQFKSNSQPTILYYVKEDGCVQYFKDTIQKQFTTRMTLSCFSLVLCSILQRYNSKAIHNWVKKGYFKH